MNALPTPSRTRPAPGRRPLLVLGAATVAVVLLVGTIVLLNKRPLERIGYFADWNVANRGYTVERLRQSGAPEHLTRLMWAFGDIDPQGSCHIPRDSHDQPWELYQRRYQAHESVSGEADDYEQELAGSLNQLRQLRELHSGLGASLSLGGWNWSVHFSTAARTEESRRAFVTSCLDLWLRGNLPVRGEEPQGGDGVAAGVFDGIDLDWEWPGGQGNPANVEHPDDPAAFTLLVAEFRRQMDELSAETGREYVLSVSLPGGAQHAEAYEPEIFDHVDFATVQGYDFSGPWNEHTAHHSNLYLPGDDGGSNSVDQAVQRYLDLGADADRLVMGIPAFGRGWQGVPGAENGRHQAAEAPADDDYDGPTRSFTDLEAMDGRRFLDEEAGSYWVYDGDEWWTYDNPEVIALKGDYVLERGLAGMMVWNLDMDADGALVRAMDDALG
ncbi:glycoside hydrolase family 18 protein [Nocardiopsis sp. MG754419]|uniref:glycoside hydrolase family 18 protein n=1 Tax=Nocardiopsis sp. MG754419 TaxID=2259865 RepID=UPI0027DB0D4B|nr:glycoside hydrolase family 18 protein [Nocardiopsis sp. MG754419]MBR8742489.1 glycosyl hydrolase [Nocardiopsis sp. MG754419]